MKPLALAIISAILCLPLPAADIVAEPFPPAHFSSLYIEMADGKTDTVIQLNGEAVEYKTSMAGKVTEDITVHPAGDDWFNFIQGLNNAKVYKWLPQYEYPGAGTTWVIDFVMPERKFTSEGSNDYPKDGAENQPQADPKAGPSVTFQLFWQAALTLVGKAPPPAPAK